MARGTTVDRLGRGKGEDLKPYRGWGFQQGNTQIAPCEQGGFTTPEVPNVHLAAAAHSQVTVPRYSLRGRGDQHQHTDIGERLLTR